MTAQLIEDIEKPKKAQKRKIEELGEEFGYLQRKWIPVDSKSPVLLRPVGMNNCVLFYGVFGDGLHPLNGWPFLTEVGIEIYSTRWWKEI